MPTESMRRYSALYSYKGEGAITNTIGTIADLVDLSGATLKVFSLLTSAGSALSACVIQASPDNVNWETIDGTTFTTLGTAVLKSTIINDARRYWRVRGNTAAGSCYGNWWWNV